MGKARQAFARLGWRAALALLSFAPALAGPCAHAQGAPAPAETMQTQGENGPPAARALSVTLTYAGDLLFDLHGPGEGRVMYDGRAGLILDSDLAAALGWRGGTAHLSLHAIHGTGPRGDRLGNLMTVSGLEARPTLRLFNLWVQQAIGPSGSLRVGQFTAAQEFMISPTAAVLVNATFGWPASFALDLPSGGPAYPLAAPGARLALPLSASTTLLAAAFAGDPAGPGGGDPQKRDRYGLNGFRLAGAPFVIVEAQQAFGSAATLKLGAWRHGERFPDLAGGPPRRGNTGVYAILDGALWSESGGGKRSLHGFVRASTSPSDRNPVDRYLDLGLSLAAPFRARPDDSVIVGWAYARRPPAAGGGRETVAELSYQATLAPGVFLQPDLQLVAPAAAAGAAAPAHAVVAGLRISGRR